MVRRARPADRDAVLAFASHTWDGWDYIPHAWPVWLEAADGVLLVALPGTPAEGGTPLDHDGVALDPQRPIAVARVALLSPAEAWLEGIRVDPRVRGMGVATDLQVAELRWAAAQGAQVVRYATGGTNEGSHRLGARHGFRLLASFRTYWSRAVDTTDEPDDEEGPSGFEEDARAAASAARAALLERLREAGLVARSRGATAESWWRFLDRDVAFRLGERLYEHRAWALQELTVEAFRQHMAQGELLAVPVAAAGDLPETPPAAVAVLTRQALPAEDVSLHLSLLVGEAEAAAALAAEVRRLAGDSIRFRLPVADASSSPAGSGPPDRGAPLEGHAAALSAAGFEAREWTLDILERPLGPAHPPPEPDDPAVLVMDEEPAPLRQ